MYSPNAIAHKACWGSFSTNCVGLILIFELILKGTQNLYDLHSDLQWHVKGYIRHNAKERSTNHTCCYYHGNKNIPWS